MKRMFRRRISSKQTSEISSLLLDDELYRVTPFLLPDEVPQLPMRSCISNESEFRISRVKLSPLVFNDSPSLTNTMEGPGKMEMNEQMEEMCGISCSARAYLPTSYSLLTHTTSHERLIRADSLKRLGLQDAHVDEIRTWPSSILLQAVSSPVKMAPDWSDANEDVIDELIEQLSERPTSARSTHSSPQGPQVRLPRYRTCPALRELSHAHRHRDSIVASPRQKQKIDEFGKWKEDTTYDERSSVSVIEELDVAPPITTLKSCRNTFGTAALPTASDDTPRTPPATRKKASQATFITTVRTEQSAHGTSVRSSSIRSRRRWQLDEILPSPCESMFRFPSLCVAAVERVSDMIASPSLASARSELFSLEKDSFDDDCASLAMSGISALTQSERHHSHVALHSTILGSPILLASEMATRAESSCDSDCSTPSMDCDLAFLQFPSLLARPKSDTELLEITYSRRPQPQPLLNHSESMPALESKVAKKTTPPLFAANNDMCISSARTTHQRTASTASVQQIIHAQQCRMDEVRAKFINTSQSSSAAMIEGVSPEDSQGKDYLVESSSATTVKCLVDKGVQTDTISSPALNLRKSKSKQRRRRPSKGRSRHRPSSSPKKAPGICISLPSPRVDDEDVNSQWSALPSRSPCHLLSVPLANDVVECEEREHTIPLDSAERECASQRRSDESTSITSRVTTSTSPATSHDHADPQNVRQAFRESTTTAAIEAMLDHLYRARDTKSDLSSGGRRHARTR